MPPLAFVGTIEVAVRSTLCILDMAPATFARADENTLRSFGLHCAQNGAIIAFQWQPPIINSPGPQNGTRVRHTGSSGRNKRLHPAQIVPVAAAVRSWFSSIIVAWTVGRM
jgi:hypothetical protein